MKEIWRYQQTVRRGAEEMRTIEKEQMMNGQMGQSEHKPGRKPDFKDGYKVRMERRDTERAHKTRGKPQNMWDHSKISLEAYLKKMRD
jgi:hypothetical protein